MSEALTRPPKENLFRAVNDGLELRSSDDGSPPTMLGHFAVFNQWTKISSKFEGTFLERIAPGAFAKTFSENRARMQSLFHHGQDPMIGSKPLGVIKVLEEDDLGAYYEVPLLDTAYVRELLPGLQAGLYGASFRFSVMKEDFVQRPRPAAHNPDGLPERTVSEARVPEFGPTPFPAYIGATAGCRSITDDILRGRLVDDEEPRGRATISVPRAVEPDPEEEARSERLYERSVARVASTPWAIHPDALATIVAVVSERAAGFKPTPEEIQERIGTRAQQPAPPAGPVAVIPLCGPIVPRANFFSDVSGLASVEGFQAAFRAALAAPDVHSILIDIDSPGGDVSLVPELAAEIRAARGQKPIVAVANTFAASAAYWIGSAADEFVASPSSQVGSIGVYSVHEDISAQQAQDGVKTTIVKAGKYKAERTPFEPLSEAAAADMQAKVDEYYDMFLQAVADGRGTDIATVRDKFGQGRTVMPSKARAAGMVDEIATFDEVLARLTADANKAAADAATAEPEPSATATTQTSEPEPPEATTPAQGRQPAALITSRKEKPSWLL